MCANSGRWLRSGRDGWMGIAVLAAVLLVCNPARGLSEERLSFDAKPFFYQGITMVPMRGIFEWLGTEVGYENGLIRAVSGEAGGHTIELRVGEPKALLDGKETLLSVPAVVQQGHAFVPLRFVSEALGASVEYDASAHGIRLLKGEKQGFLPMPAAGASARPEPYNYRRLIAYATREEKLGDQARQAGDSRGARAHYESALAASRRIHEEEAARYPLVKAQDALLQRDYDEIERLLAKASDRAGHYTKANLAARERAERGDEIAGRIADKLGKLPLSSPISLSQHSER